MWFLGIALILFLANLIFIFQTIKIFYGKELMVRIDPLFGENQPLIRNSDYWLIGDSRIARWNIPDSIISSDKITNLGVEGQTSAQVYERTSHYFQTHKSKFAIIQVGINDLKAIGIFPGKKQLIINSTTKNIKLILSKCIENDCRPIFTTIMPYSKVEFYRKPFWNSIIDSAIIEVNKTIALYCRQENIQIIDFYSILKSNTGNTKNLLYQDCLHLNNKGYDCLNIDLKKSLLLH
jgi:lysophospholipase L1-like esterase